MNIAYFDCQFGASGDMLLGALLDAGLDESQWRAELSKIDLPANSFDIKIQQVQRQTISAKKLDVILPTEPSLVQSSAVQSSASGKDQHGPSAMHGNHSHEPPHDHSHEHPHDHVQAHSHDHTHDVGHAHSGPAVAMQYIQSIINNSKISQKAKDLAQKIILCLGNCEGAVHGMAPEVVYFHEVGAIDSIIDIVGFCIAYDLLNIEKSFVSAVPMGRGYVNTAHGYFPVPSPAVAKILAQVKAPITNYVIDFECLTPTGAAILAEICPKWGVMPGFDNLLAVGYGAGKKNSDNHPNVCRVMLGGSTD